jgi:hypothetical protein
VTLRSPGASPHSLRPAVGGSLRGVFGAPAAARPVEWILDTGAEITTVRRSVGEGLGATPTAWTASPTTGAGGIRVVDGLAVSFEARDADGAPRAVTVGGYVGIKDTDRMGDLLGMQQVALGRARIFWDPAARRGVLRLDRLSGARPWRPWPRRRAEDDS